MTTVAVARYIGCGGEKRIRAKEVLIREAPVCKKCFMPMAIAKVMIK